MIKINGKEKLAKTNINWFPGHMKKTEKLIKDNLSLCDGVVEIIDARIPLSSQNPDIRNIINSKTKIMLLNKSDLADKYQTRLWLKYLAENGIFALAVNCKIDKGLSDFINLIKFTVFREKIESWRSKGIVNRAIKLMVVGIPNVGKSSFINKITGRNRAQVANKPGITRQKQWYKIDSNIEVLDTPGVLWPKFNDENTALNLAFTGAIKDDVIPIQSLAVSLLDFFKQNDFYRNVISKYSLDLPDFCNTSSWDILELISIKKCLFLNKTEADIERAAKRLIYDFRSGALGKISLERVNG